MLLSFKDTDFVDVIFKEITSTGFHDTLFPPIRWLTQRLHPSAAAPARACINLVAFRSIGAKVRSTCGEWNEEIDF